MRRMTAPTRDARSATAPVVADGGVQLPCPARRPVRPLLVEAGRRGIGRWRRELVVADGLAARAAGRAATTSVSTPSCASSASTSARPRSTSPSPTPNWRSSGTLTSPWTSREGPVAVFEKDAMAAKLRASGLAEGFDGAGIGVPAGPLPRGCAGGSRRSCRAGTASPCGRRSARNSAQCRGRQRREPDGAGAALGRRPHRARLLVVKIGTGIGCGIVVGGRYIATTAQRGRHRAHPAVPEGAPVRLRQPGF